MDGKTEVTIVLTVDEINALLQLVDLGVKSGGLQVAASAAILHGKIAKVVGALQKESEKSDS